jgi:hypothetical protein
MFVPAGCPDAAEGELWAIYFDGESRSVAAVLRRWPLARCRFSRSQLAVAIGDARLDERSLSGEVDGGGLCIDWDLTYRSPQEPLLMHARVMYGAPLPKAKLLVGSPNAIFAGVLNVGSQRVAIDEWVGSQNHNWGSQHTDRYAWGQVAGFDGEPGSFLEIATARLRVGPLWTPRMTVMVLRLDGEEHRLSSVPQSLRASGRYDLFHWAFASETAAISISGTITGEARSFVGLPYRNPPGGSKTCLNTKIARCHVTVRRPGTAPRILVSQQRTAFEILTDAVDHGIPVLAVASDRGGLGRGCFASHDD